MNALYIISGLGILAMFAEIFSFRKLLFPMVVLGLAASLVAVGMDWNVNGDYPLFNNMLTFDNYADIFSGICILIVLLWILMSRDFFSNESRITDYFALVLFSLAGAVSLVSFSNMTMLFLGIEILSIPMYVLAGSNKTDVSSNESAFKYFLMGAFASGILLFGIALVYGGSGSFDLQEIAGYIKVSGGNSPGFFYLGIIFILAGLSFKVAAVPFHFWAPDVYQGAPTPVTALMATLVKTAAIAAFLRLFSGTFGMLGDHWSSVMAVICALSLFAGNLMAAKQQSVKRLFAYSGISHAGFMLMAILAVNERSSQAVMYYTLAYSLASLLAFSVLMKVMGDKGNDGIESFNGLGKKSPFLAFSMTLALLSFAGIPPLAGFFAKYYIFVAALKSGFLGLTILAILGSLVGVYYYFRIIIAMYFGHPGESENSGDSTYQRLLAVICIAAILLLGLFPDFIFSLSL